MPRGLYVHIPFCHKHCHYCDFVITTNRSDQNRARFFTAIQKEIRQARKKYGRLTFDTLYFGGGTPSTLSVKEMEELLDWLRDAFDFHSGFEFTCEINPEDAVQEKLSGFRKLGMNRASLGVQSFSENLLSNMGRNHTADDTVRAVKAIKDAGFQSISLDLIIKLPRQTFSDVSGSLDQIIALNPGQVSIYDLDVHDSTVYGSLAKKGKLILPSEDAHMEMASVVESKLSGAGFIQYELTNFARPGFESRHNLIYWHNQDYLGLGPGAFSYLNGIRYQFAPSLSRYFEKSNAGDWTPDTEDFIDEKKKEIETLLTGLRLREGIDLDQFRVIRSSIENNLVNMDGLLEKRGTRIAFTSRGRFLAESIFHRLVV